MRTSNLSKHLNGLFGFIFVIFYSLYFQLLRKDRPLIDRHVEL